ICVALWFLHRELAGLSFAAITGYIKSIPLPSLLASFGFAACSYLVLTSYDAIALRYLEKRLPYRNVAMTSFMAYAVGYNVGLAAFSGGSIRYRMYSLAGLTASEIATLIVFVTATFALGASALLGIALLMMPASQTAILKVQPALVTLAGGLLLAVPFVYLAISFLRRTPVKSGHWDIAWPAPTIAFRQIGVSVADLTFASATLYILLEPSLQIGFFPFLGIYLLAMAAGLISSVPAGIGVFEAVMVAALPQVQTTALVGAIIVYRMVYYIAPLTLALTLLVAHESRQHGKVLRQSVVKAGGWLSGVAPQVVGTLVFLAGVVLLVSGASPAVVSRLAMISQLIPLPVLELSHLAGSVVGVGLLVLSRGLFRRLQTAYLAAFLALTAGALVSLVKGLDYEEAIVLGAILVTLWFARHEFYRQGSIATQRFSAQWIAAIAAVLCLMVWVGLVSYRHVGYSNRLWWQFAFDAEAPRMLRAGVISAVSIFGFALWKVLQTGPGVSQPPVLADENQRVKNILATAKNSSANAALMGDKRFLWSADKRAFIMYQVSGDSWIALGDPVGPPEQQEELAWAFRELADRHNGRAVFYQVGEQFLSLYIDVGLTLSKLGEDARVSLKDFSLQGSHRADLRQADNRAKKHGAIFEMVPCTAVPSLL
ncbi:MAG: bifunctional lysylphosphatidylglycerol flippase/synthetase MprF, partial [Lysobacterales bacterium]